MPKLLFCCLLLLALSGGAIAAEPDSGDGSGYLAMDEDDKTLYAAGFLAGVNYFYLYATGERYSLPSNMTGRRMAVLLSDYLREHPKEIYQDLDYLAFKAVISAYPLPRPWR